MIGRQLYLAGSPETWLVAKYIWLGSPNVIGFVKTPSQFPSQIYLAEPITKCSYLFVQDCDWFPRKPVAILDLWGEGIAIQKVCPFSKCHCYVSWAWFSDWFSRKPVTLTTFSGAWSCDWFCWKVYMFFENARLGKEVGTTQFCQTCWNFMRISYHLLWYDNYMI